MKKLAFLIVILAFISLNEAKAQWATSGNNIYNTNTGFVGIGNSSPTTLLYVGKNMTEPTITVRNLGGAGGASFRMWDNASGADWKFKATNTGGFKIRDNANGLDVIVIESGSFANAIYIRSTDNVGIGTATPNISAILDLQTTNKGFLLPRLTEAQIAVISNPADGLFVYCTTDGKLYIYVAAIGQWKGINFGTETIDPPYPCGMPITINHVTGAVAPVDKTVTYGTLTNIPGEPSKCWISSNLGADHQATEPDDETEASAGWYWQFNRMQGYKHDDTIRTPNTTWITPINENSDWLAANDPCTLELGNDWRLPTVTEWSNVIDAGGWIDAGGPWDSELKMHAAGYLDFWDGSQIYRGYRGFYWSSNQFDNLYGDLLYFSPWSCWISEHTNNSEKAYGYPVRCIHD